MEYGHTADFAHHGFVRGCIRTLGGVLRFVILTVLVFFSLLVAMARADELNLLVNGKAIHINAPSGSNLNEENWGLGLQYDWNAINKEWVPFVTASGFSDSNNNPSYYAGGGGLRRFQGETLHLDIGAIGFLMTRKGYKNDKPFFGALPAFSVGTERVSVNMTYIPKVEPKMVALWFFQLKIKLHDL